MVVVREVTAHFDSTRQSEFRRVLIFSMLLHLGGFALLSWMPAFPLVTSPEAIMVSLVAAPSGVRAAPQAAPRPKPKPPKPAPVVLPKEPGLPKPKPAPEDPKVAPPEQEYVDVMAQLRAELDEPAPEAPAEPVQTAALGGGGAGPGRPVPPEVARWLRDARIHVRRNWTLPGNFRMQSLTAEVKVKLDAAGNVKGKPRVARRSGNPWYDDGVVRSIQKASPLPAPPEAGAWSFVFTSDEDF
ncbi:MAG: TonB family protein [Deltaproteobacteria bacterium]|nr:TonB family protein [Deltaproteobacteria bacterium]